MMCDDIMWDIEYNKCIIKDNHDWYITINRSIKIEKIRMMLNASRK